MTRDSVESLTRDLKDVLLKTKQELKNKDDYIKKQNTIQELTKKEYQKLYDEYSDLKEKLTQYDSYVRTQRIERKKKEQNDIEKQKKVQEFKQVNNIALLNEIKNLKKINMLNDLTGKSKKTKRIETDDDEEEEEEDEEPVKKKEKKKKKLVY